MLERQSHESVEADQTRLGEIRFHNLGKWMSFKKYKIKLISLCYMRPLFDTSLGNRVPEPVLVDKDSLMLIFDASAFSMS